MKIVKALLRSVGLNIQRIPRGGVTGYSLEQDLARLIVNECPTCIDIGANIGQTVHLFRSCLRKPRILSYEPDPRAFESLKRFEGTPGVQLFNKGIGDFTGVTNFNICKRSLLNSILSLDASKENRFRDEPVIGRREIEITTIDDELAKHSIERIDILKSDTQGFDLQVLRGASGSLEAGIVKFVLVEINNVEMYCGQASFAEIITFLAAKGYYLVDLYEKVRSGATIAWATSLFARRSSEFHGDL